MQFAKISFGNDRGHSAFRFFTEYNFLLSNWTSCLPSTGLNLSCWEFVMTSNYLLSVKCNFSWASDWSCSVLQCLPLFQCCIVCLCERGRKVWVLPSAAEPSGRHGRIYSLTFPFLCRCWPQNKGQGYICVWNKWKESSYTWFWSIWFRLCFKK